MPRTALTTLLATVIACGPSADADRADQAPDSAGPQDSTVLSVNPADDAGCGMEDSTAYILSGRGVAAIRIGMSFGALRSRCRIMSDSTDPVGNEGMPERRAIVAMGADSAIVIVNEDRVHRIEITSARFRTANSTGIGSVAGDLRRDGGRLLTGDRGVFVTLPDQCGLSFRLANIPVGRGDAWSSIPDSTPVSLVLVTGCD